jgi:hypothetical protein
MLTGSVVFATLLSEVQEMHQQVERLHLAKSNRIQLAVDFLQAHEVPMGLQQEIIAWTRFSFEQQQIISDKQCIVESLPPLLHSRLIQFLHSSTLSKAGIIGFVSSLDESFMMNLCNGITYEPVPQDSRLVCHFVHLCICKIL